LSLETKPPKTASKRRTALYWLVLLGSASVVFAFDQSTKAWVTANLAFGESITPIPALADFFAITRSANRGAAFSILPQAGDLFLIIALVMIVGVLLFYRRIPDGHWLERIALGLVLGGVSGNAIDRIRFGYVVDFVHLQLQPLISNVSNPADHAVVFGMIMLFLTQWFGEREKDEERTLEPGAGAGTEPSAGKISGDPDLSP
jgi:signal peptidase II